MLHASCLSFHAFFSLRVFLLAKEVVNPNYLQLCGFLLEAKFNIVKLQLTGISVRI